MGDLATLFLARSSGAAGERDALEHALDEAIARGTTAWPGLAVTSEDFVTFLAERAPDLAALAALRAADLYLACGCVARDARALEAFDRRYLANVGEYVARVRRDASFVDDVRQELREKLFVGSAERPARIVDYAGTGALESWVRVAAVRTALDILDRDKRHEPVEEPPEDFLGATGDPELDYVKARYAAEFREAFRAALADLEAEERSMLRFHVLDGLDIGRIGALFGVSRATIGRRVVEVRNKLLDRTRERLGARLEANPSEVDSLIGALGSRLDLSLRRFLAAD
jgi:RNA polymerase sigma-70 factor (ECF subfamily)